jgi:hypothetical protein
LQGVTITTDSTTTYERLDASVNAESPASVDSDPSSKARFPVLFWAGAVLFAVNVLILFCMWLSPELKVTMYGVDADRVSAYFRPSPFIETVQLAKARKSKQPERVRPVFYEESQIADFTEAASLALPRSTPSLMATPAASSTLTVYRPEQPVSGERLTKIVDSYSDYPRVTASLNHAGTIELAPQAASERKATRVLMSH